MTHTILSLLFVSYRHKELRCNRTLLPCIFPMLMEREPELHFYIFYEESAEDTFITLGTSHLKICFNDIKKTMSNWSQLELLKAKETGIFSVLPYKLSDEVVKAAFTAGATASLVKRESLLTSLQQAVQWIDVTRSIVIVLSPRGSITALFRDVCISDATNRIFLHYWLLEINILSFTTTRYVLN